MSSVIASTELGSADRSDRSRLLDGISCLGVIGAGQMGRGIAQLAASHGFAVTLADSGRDIADRGRTAIAQQLDRLVDKGKMTADDKTAILGRISPADLYGGDLEAADFVVEAATENVATKREIFETLDRVCRSGIVLATNTSSISITMIGAAVTRPERVIGMHFMNPPPLMKLVEIIRGLATGDYTYQTTRALAERLGKETVVSRDIPGFIVNRVLMPMLNEACFAFYEGIGSVEDMDTAINLGLNHPMGPFALMDLIGLDTTLSILEVMHRDLGDSKYRPCPLLRQYVAAGWLGRKAGRGFYRYAMPAQATGPIRMEAP
ncbi:MAG TPA: 3-hydroxyacyl-CoA dehydrogenase NAD-binding domain-containing protein [Polyangia bacterium]|nr:3-hydroxyacyl-CoA dehydrogenase NAD-binding domain-containing protein [Polyangia bacterium]